MDKIYDLVIAGGGPAGLSAAVYAARSKLKTLVLESDSAGGQLTDYEEMENYPGFTDITAPELAKNFKEHARKFGALTADGEVQRLDLESSPKKVMTKDGKTYHTRSILIATGAEPRKLDIPGEKELQGRGVSYCATCDAEFFVDLDVMVVGNGNSAVEEAIYLTNFARRVTLVVIHEEGKMDADSLFQERAYENDKIDFVWNSTLKRIEGDQMVDKAVVENIRTGELQKLDYDGIFIFVGREPSTEILEDTGVELDQSGYIVTDEGMRTNVPGVYAAGDVRQKPVRQVITAAGDGATAAVECQKYLEATEHWRENVLDTESEVIVFFWSPTDDDSLEAMRLLEELEIEEKTDKELVRIDAYGNDFIPDRYGVEEIPTVITIAGGEEKERIIRPTAKDLEGLLA
ncbi:thioredoxin-disulfide reductase [Halarsenatibacter silvermanii]|uniref:Thioredoxin reductase n=1 Tax=Halarsenatibacter silvermanii TaxID=321763 RepID=A0A1G9N269_9FIRM|nr:thioredoxin-disulfide reductase [Halarsenatibacter silvermanii]SDL80598.1 thioredoxin reductase (NADPH) [Halarsenatibacter silvermanii]